MVPQQKPLPKAERPDSFENPRSSSAHPVAAENAHSNDSNAETALQTTLGARVSQSNGVAQVAKESSVAPSPEPPISNDIQPTIPEQVLIPIPIAAKPAEIASNDHNILRYPFYIPRHWSPWWKDWRRRMGPVRRRPIFSNKESIDWSELHERV